MMVDGTFGGRFVALAGAGSRWWWNQPECDARRRYIPDLTVIRLPGVVIRFGCFRFLPHNCRCRRSRIWRPGDGGQIPAPNHPPAGRGGARAAPAAWSAVWRRGVIGSQGPRLSDVRTGALGARLAMRPDTPLWECLRHGNGKATGAWRPRSKSRKTRRRQANNSIAATD